MSKMNKIALSALAVLLAVATHADLPDKDGYIHMGVATCAASQCHGSAVPGQGADVLQNEYVTWTQDDPHSRAYEVLGNSRSKRIAARLGLQSAATAAICLDCHADNVPPGLRGERFHLSDGVGCESCHGGAEHWLATHYNAPAITHQANREAGLYPTEGVAKRSDLCLSCHLGTRDKFATHRIMAAGHPRLAFELDTFTELWRTAGRQPHYRIDADYRDRKGPVSHSFNWAAGLLAASRRRLNLMSGPVFDGEGLFPELAFYDCHACHRSMKTLQWRPLPRHGGVGPGVPFANDGTLVLSMALARALSAADGEAIKAGLIALHRAGSENIEALRKAAATLDAALANLQGRLSTDALRGRQMQLLREVLGAGAQGNYIDYISAEQAFMAVQMLVIEINDPSLENQLDRIADALNDDERYRPAQFAAMLRALSAPAPRTDDEQAE